MKVALMYGGRSAEHKVSIESAKSVYRALQSASHDVLLIGISQEGRWYLQQQIEQSIQPMKSLYLAAGDGLYSEDGKLFIDVAIATTHGSDGEDGNLQGLCHICNIPLCGCDTASSALGMHKALASELFSMHGIPTAPSVVIDVHQDIEDQSLFAKICNTLGSKLFIKPESGGSSIGVTALPMADHIDFKKAVNLSRRYSKRVLVQSLIETVTEVECGVLRTMNGDLIIAGPAKVVDEARAEDLCLSYRHKYGEVNTAHLQLPSGLSKEMEMSILSYARKAFDALGCEGFARVDFFVQDDHIYINEINTLPGMTEKSHYPILLASVGYSLPVVLEHLMYDALRRFKEDQDLEYRAPVL